MLKNVNLYPEVVETLKESLFEFFLTGSRFFEEPNPNDWDFYIQDDGKTNPLSHINGEIEGSLREFLEANDFQPIIISTYNNDPNIAEVWAHLPYPIDDYRLDNLDERNSCLSNAADVHIQIVKDINARHIVMKAIREHMLPLYWKIDKEDRRMFYRTLFEVYAAGKHHDS